MRIFRSIFFLVGAGFSAAVGYFGMSLAVRANLRVAAAANTVGREPAMTIGLRTGATVGMLTVGLGLLGASVVVIAFQDDAPDVLEGFGFGAALLAMFMRVGGGIFTKAADVGADLVGKVENNIPEDDPRNAATIADNVGDNVGDCAGMAADLFESYAVTLVAALILGSQAFGDKGLVYPLLIPAIGALTAVAGVYLTKPKAGVSGLSTINRAFYLSAGIAALASVVLSFVYLPTSFADFGELGSSLDLISADTPDGNPALIASVAVVIGIVLAAAILALTGYFTGTEYRPVKDVGKTSLTGAATVILSGLSVGFESAVYTTLVLGAAVFGAFLLGTGSLTISLFAVALAGCGLLTTVGSIVAMDTFGPVSDNAQGVAEMSGDVSPEGAQILTDLDAVGNTTKAITKGIAIATAVLAATALFGSYATTVIEELQSADAAADELFSLFVFDPSVLVGVLLGSAVVFLFSGLAINAVARAAGAVVYEVRRQFRDIPGIMEGTGRPEYGKVVDIVTRDSLRELITPGVLAVLAPVDRRLRPRLHRARRLPRRRHRHRHPDGGVPGQLRWCLGQRQEDRRGRPPRRQGLARPRGHDHRRHRRRPVQGHRRPGHQPADQGDEPGVAADRERRRLHERRRRPERRRADRDRPGGGGDHRGRRLHLQAARDRHGRRRPGGRGQHHRRPHGLSTPHQADPPEAFGRVGLVSAKLRAGR